MKTGLILLTMVAAGCGHGGDYAALAPMPATPYRLGAGDEMRIAVFGLDPLNAEYVVGDAGAISLPLVGTVPVAGKTVAETEAAVKQAILSRDIVKDPVVSAQIVKYRPFFIVGEVQRPGQYPYVPGMTLTTAVAIAGGYTFRAETKSAMVSRRAGTNAIEGRVGRNAAIMPGDTIQIRESWF